MRTTGLDGAGRPAMPYQMERAEEDNPVAVKQTPGQEKKSDSVQISSEGRAHARGMTQSDLEMVREQMEVAKQQAEATGEAFDQLAKCFKIAMRIMAGDLVPTKDKQFLLEKQPKLYIQATSMQRDNDDPKKHKTLLEDKKKKAEGQRSEETAAPSTPAPTPAPDVGATETQPAAL